MDTMTLNMSWRRCKYGSESLYMCGGFPLLLFHTPQQRPYLIFDRSQTLSRAQQLARCLLTRCHPLRCQRLRCLGPPLGLPHRRLRSLQCNPKLLCFSVPLLNQLFFPIGEHLLHLRDLGLDKLDHVLLVLSGGAHGCQLGLELLVPALGLLQQPLHVRHDLLLHPNLMLQRCVCSGGCFELLLQELVGRPLGRRLFLFFPDALQLLVLVRKFLLQFPNSI
mmetsp:Transcript_35651/g.57686  ORF Transcript_35651/g.57686 Transcript_35651/m.57686 type:complete len:221 (-) Transcript_35651:1577-2239(-)